MLILLIYYIIYEEQKRRILESKFSAITPRIEYSESFTWFITTLSASHKQHPSTTHTQIFLYINTCVNISYTYSICGEDRQCTGWSSATDEGRLLRKKITFENLLFMTQFLEGNPCVKRDMFVIIFNVLCVMHTSEDINSFDFPYTDVRNHIFFFIRRISEKI